MALVVQVQQMGATGKEKWARYLFPESLIAIDSIERIESHSNKTVHSLSQRRNRQMTVQVVNHPVLLHKLSLLRDARTKSKQFRDLVNELTLLLGMTATQTLDLIQTTRQVGFYCYSRIIFSM